jgi:hypothetical protein
MGSYRKDYKDNFEFGPGFGNQIGNSIIANDKKIYVQNLDDSQMNINND